MCVCVCVCVCVCGWVFSLRRAFSSHRTSPPRTQDDLRIEDHWRLDGTHYARTCEEWLRRMDANKRDILPILANTYPNCEDPMVRFTMWRLFYIACAEMFAFNGGKQWVVSHYRFVNPDV